jgi:hypothetical protein
MVFVTFAYCADESEKEKAAAEALRYGWPWLIRASIESWF